MTDKRNILIEAGREFHRRGWVEGTGGNLSARHDDGSFWITASGRHKGELGAADFVRVDLDGCLLEQGADGARPSAETSIHQVLYRHDASIGAVYHVHSVEANLVGCFTAGDSLPLPPLEVLKGFNVWTEEPEVAIPVFRNHAAVPRIASEFEAWLRESDLAIPAMLIRRHGVTAWGATPEMARNHVELIEFIFRYMVGARRLGL